MKILRFYDRGRDFNGYFVHMNTDNFRLYFSVYPCVDFIGLNGEKGTAYQAKDSSEMTIEFEKDKVQCLFEGSYCWRGVWEGRIYFRDDEYWDDNLMEMAKLYENSIKPWCETFIKEREPLAGYF